MQQLHGRFSLVIYDMPPILGFADSSLLAAHTDGMVLVVGLGKTDKACVIQALDTLRLAPLSILGLVANGIRSYTTQTHGYDQYQAYYSAQKVGHSPPPPPARPQAASVLAPPQPASASQPNAHCPTPAEAESRWQMSEPSVLSPVQSLPAGSTPALPFARIRFFLLTGVGSIVVLTLLVQIFLPSKAPNPDTAPLISSPPPPTAVQPNLP